MSSNKECEDVISDLAWATFLIWLKEAHHLSSIYTPDKYSIKLWQEYERRSK